MSLCPSCGIPPDGDRCPRCGARLRAGHWRFDRDTQEGEMPDPKPIQKSTGADIVMCKACSEAEGREIFFDRRFLRKHEEGGGMPWARESKTVVRCPEGHTVDVEPAPPSA